MSLPVTQKLNIRERKTEIMGVLGEVRLDEVAASSSDRKKKCEILYSFLFHKVFSLLFYFQTCRGHCLR
jgi:hypothetical protein